MSLSANKLKQFRVQIRKQNISSLIKKLRYEMVQNNQRQRLQALIAIPLQSFTIQNLNQLVQHVNLDQTNAILLLGNLVIDRFISIDVLEQQNIKLGKNQYITWLINAFTEINYCTSEMFEYLVNKISIKKSSFNLENALQGLQRCMKANPDHTLTYMDNKQEFLLSLVNHIHDPNDRVCILSLGLIVLATNYSEQMPLQMQKVVGNLRLEKALQIALMKVNTQPRVLAVQIANNLLMSGVILKGAMKRMIQNSFSQKQNVRLQFSFYLIAIAQKSSLEFLIELIQDHSLLQVLKDFTQKQINKGKYSKQMKQNTNKTINFLIGRFDQKRQRQLFKDLQRMGITVINEQMLDQGTLNNIL